MIENCFLGLCTWSAIDREHGAAHVTLSGVVS